MKPKVALFWPGDGREYLNRFAMATVTQTTTRLEVALRRLGYEPYRVKEAFIAKPHQSIQLLAPIDDPMIGVFVHWCYGPHTVDGVVGKNNPLLLASNFLASWPGLAGMLNTGACLNSVGRQHSRIWSDQLDWAEDKTFLARLEQWCKRGSIEYADNEIAFDTSISAESAALAKEVAQTFFERRALILMLGDTSLGMINSYFGPRLLHRHHFTEHKVDQARLLGSGLMVDQARIDSALSFVKDKDVKFYWVDEDACDFNEFTTSEQLRDYLAIKDLVEAHQADCIGWQYQPGLLPLRPPPDLVDGLFNSTCRPESNGDTVVAATTADQGNIIPMEMMKRLLKAKGLHQAVMCHAIRWGARQQGRFLWLLQNYGSCGAYAYNHDPNTLAGVHSHRQPVLQFPYPGGTFSGECLPGKITWARCYDLDGQLWIDVGRGEVVKLPPQVRDSWWNDTTPQWPFMAADLGIERDTLMACFGANHLAMAYGDIFDEMVALSRELGFKVRILQRQAS